METRLFAADNFVWGNWPVAPMCRPPASLPVTTPARVAWSVVFFFQAEDGIRYWSVTGVQTCALPISVREALGRTTPAPGPFRRLEGLGPLRRVLAVDQSPIGRTPRSVPATFLGLWDEMRRAFAATPEARRRGFGPARFSFNTAAGGRCPARQGQGSISHEMSFLPDVTTPCEACGGARFEPATLEVRWHGFNAGEALRLTVDEAVEAFAALPSVVGPLRCLSELGVGYL